MLWWIIDTNKTQVTMTLDYVLKYKDVVLGPIKSCAQYFKEGPNSKFGSSLKVGWNFLDVLFQSWKVWECVRTRLFHGTLYPKVWISLCKVQGAPILTWQARSHCFKIRPHSFRMLIEALRKLWWLYMLVRLKLTS